METRKSKPIKDIIKSKLATIAEGKEAFRYLTELWIKQKKINKQEYLEYVDYWSELQQNNKLPKTQYEEWEAKVVKEFGGKVVEEKTVDEVVDEIPF